MLIEISFHILSFRGINCIVSGVPHVKVANDPITEAVVIYITGLWSTVVGRYFKISQNIKL